MNGHAQLDLFGGPAITVEVLPPPEPEPDEIAAPLPPICDGEQITLFDLAEPWRIEWNGMPEFSMEDQTPVRSILVHFETEGDIALFEAAIGQSVGKVLRSVWYPEAEITRYVDKRYAVE